VDLVNYQRNLVKQQEQQQQQQKQSVI